MEKILEDTKLEKIQFYPHWIFEYNSKKYIYGAFSNRIFELDDVTYQFLDTGEKINPEYDYPNDIVNITLHFFLKHVESYATFCSEA